MEGMGIPGAAMNCPAYGMTSGLMAPIAVLKQLKGQA